MRRLLLLAGALVACSGAHTPTVEAAAPATTTSAQPIVHEEPVSAGCPSNGGMTLEGQLGTLSTRSIDRASRASAEDFTRCYHQRLETMPFIAGHIELKLRVATDGTVRWVLPTATTLGDREVERCMMDHARALHFDAPCGGEAEVTFPLDMDGGPDNRAATAWQASRVAGAMRQHSAAIARCRRGNAAPIAVTLYASADGRVATAGASVPTEEALPIAECVLHEVATWRLPSPGSWYAKATIQVP